MRKPAACLAAIVAWLAAAGPVEAAVERYAVVIGNDEGNRADLPLRYAESDAAKVASTLGEIGGIEPANVVLLRGSEVDGARRAIIAMNDRIRSRTRAGVQAMLIVYFSGHGDNKALHLGSSRFPLDELEQLVRGSPATFRLLIVDSCRSGALTRVKGGAPGAPLSIELDDQLAGEGVVFLTSSSSSEDAQESDEIQGSFFTHFLVSGLVGAADSNQDGLVALREAYRYAYEATVRESSRTFAGIQHPTFRFELGGQGDVWLTRIGQAGQRRGLVRFPAGTTYLLLAGGPGGPVVAELGSGDRARSISVAPGRYFVRGRGHRALFEGTVDVAPGRELAIDASGLDRVEYARLVRKGGGIDMAHAVSIGVQSRTAVAEGTSLCTGPIAGYSIDMARLSLGGRVGLCRGEFENRTLTARTDELEVGVRIARAWDWRLVTADVGVGIGAGLARDTFESRGVAPTRWSWLGSVELGGALTRDLSRGVYLATELGGRAYGLSVRDRDGQGRMTLRLAARAALAVGLHF